MIRFPRTAAFLVGLLLCAGSARAQVAPSMTVQLDLFRRTTPSLDRRSPDQFPGRLLYPGYADLAGTLELHGPPQVLEPVLAQLRAAEQNPQALAELLMLEVRRLAPSQGMIDALARPSAVGGGGPSFTLPGATDGLQVELPAGDLQGSLRVAFRIPVELGETWSEGYYELSAGFAYEQEDAQRSAGIVPLPFEVRALRKDSPDELNLLTNAWKNTPPGVAETLYARGEYTRKQLFERALELDPHDAWARHALASSALRLEGQPRRAVALYEQILADVRAQRAHRLRSLLPQQNCGHHDVPRTWSGWEEHVQRELQRAKWAATHSRRAKEKVTARFQRGGPEALAALATSAPGETLWDRDDVWRAVWAIRGLGAEKVQYAHADLVAELAKLPRAPGLLQRELVGALASLHGREDQTLRLLNPHREREVIDWWLARPRPEDVR